MFERLIANKVTENLSNFPALAILGSRQVGKTTLALEIAKDKSTIYLDLENPVDLQKLSDPAHYLGLHSDKLVILDEAQRYPDLFNSLRGVIDKGRREGRVNWRFMILGSASNELLKQSSESLAGRICYLVLSGLNPFEIEAVDSEHMQKLWVRGGYPASYTAKSDKISNVWRRDLIRTYLERDIPQMGPRIPAIRLRHFWTMLAHSQGELLNASKLAASLGLSNMTVNRYLDLMVDLLLVRRLNPFHSNVKKRLVKSPRIYVRDSGIVHTLLQISDYDQLLGHPVLGKSWEGFVIENILSVLPDHVEPFFYRTSRGAEIDLLLQTGFNNYWAIDIKSSQSPKVKPGFHIACEDLKVRRKFVVYTGEDMFPHGDETTVISLPLFMEELKGA